MYQELKALSVRNMSKRIYIDTNVLVDVVTGRQQPHVIYSQQLFAAAVVGDIKICTSALSLVTVSYVARKYGLSRTEVTYTLKTLLNFMDVVDLSAENVISMLDSGWNDYEDATQAFSAKLIEADYIATGNIKDFKDSEIEALTPQDLLGII